MRERKDPNRSPRTVPALRVSSTPGSTATGGTAAGFPAFVYNNGDPIPTCDWDTIGDVNEFVNTPDLPEERLGIVFLDKPSTEDIIRFAGQLNLSTLLVEDLIAGGQRPKLEHHKDALFMVLSRPVYIDDLEFVEFTELHIVQKDNLFVVIRKNCPAKNTWNYRRMLPSKKQVQAGPEAVLYHFLDFVVDAAMPVARGIQTDVDEIEMQVFTGDPAAPERIYRLTREVIELQRALTPLVDIIEDLEYGFTGREITEALRAFLDDVEDHLTRTVAQIQDFRDLLTQILQVNATLADQRRNEDMKTVSSWGAILLLPTLIGSIYGMNFDVMPELHWRYGYLGAIGLMLLSATALYFVFKKRDWL
ncbi:hypothetical protein BSR29_07095 [Boudabousia liubingyangii]|uniref:Magnesium and cobalt transport protein CorA n=1 Tax=Boudabousia liubingyangii TaxID=1921764 RepID=A0A1Q5PK82_9ACTO|nr:magnesium and cobalt transport protein CorA [Boudabousia liubingyangii]OKL46581.1 hypothetical protein BSR29_07095 [Boudabousia liubingyangii]